MFRRLSGSPFIWLLSLAVLAAVELFCASGLAQTAIPVGARVEGSTRFGGMQPDYIVNIDDPVFEPLINYATEIGQSDLPFWSKVQKITSYIHTKVLPRGSYKGTYYLRLMARYRNEKKDVPLSEYVKVQAGVCRENAMILHHALLAAGIPNQYVYAQIKMWRSDFSDEESHAFVVFDHDGEQWTADSYNYLFNGFRFDHLMSKSGVSPRSKGAGISQETDIRRRIIQIHDHPLVHFPNEVRSCQSIFAN